MAFVLIGVALVVLRMLELGPFAQLGWGWVLAPFGLAIAWWSWSDATGLTRRREEARMEERRQARRQKNIDALGLPDPRKRKPGQKRR